jgi:hypothetical protein
MPLCNVFLLLYSLLPFKGFNAMLRRVHPVKNSAGPAETAGLTTGWVAAPRTRRSVLACLLLLAAATTAAPPKGLMLNLDFQQIEDGLILNRTLYPLHVPLGELETGTSNNRTVLVFKEGQGLDVPHSSLLDPDGSGWIAGIRVFALTEGLIMSQANEEKGYAVYIRDGAVQVAIQTAHSTFILREEPEKSITPCLNQWISIEVIIKPELAMLILNRAQVALIPLQAPLSANDCRIRIGTHEKLPAPLVRSKEISPEGFTGAISSVKIFRQ